MSVTVTLAILTVDVQAELLFLPGDSFFCTELTSAKLSEWRNGERMTMTYKQPWSERGLNGYAGFRQLEITGDFTLLLERIEREYSLLRKGIPKTVEISIDENGNEVLKEINGFTLLLYNKHFAFSHYHIGVTYNEDWNAYSKKLKKSDRRPGSILREHQSFVRTYDAAIEDWKHAKDVEPLAVSVPDDIDWWILGRPIETPVKVDADDIVVVVLIRCSMKDYFYRIPFCRFSAITSKRTRSYEFREDRVFGDDWMNNKIRIVSGE
ncbi:hypothetical protein AB1L42_18325 [Thalassoglobus sp. JC818]|uniref:hypothetical protein n=1 Tax=Thalassoglobus sp. JC818 TaxID=3232136 RepID=UPI003457C81E